MLSGSGVEASLIDNSMDFLSGGGDMGALMRAPDWTGSALGSPGEWPDALKTAVGICLHSRFPMVVWWGPVIIQRALSFQLQAETNYAITREGVHCIINLPLSTIPEGFVHA